jgi:hypothetical protein
MSAAMLATGQLLAASSALTQAFHATQSATSFIERNLPLAEPTDAMVARVREDAAAIRTLVDRLDAALAASAPRLREAA